MERESSRKTAKRNAARNILLGKISLAHSCLSGSGMAYLVAACNAYKENPDVFMPTPKVRAVFLSVNTNKAHYKNDECKFFYDVVKDMMEARELDNIDGYIIKGDAQSVYENVQALNTMSEREKFFADACASLEMKRAEYERKFAMLIECQQREAMEYFDHLLPYKLYRARRTSAPARNRRYTNEEIASELHELYGDDYDCSEVEYKDCKHCIKLTCKKHHVTFERTMANLRKGWGCPECNKEKGITWRKDIASQYDPSRKSERWSTRRFIKESESIFGKGTFDYSLCQYVNNDTKVTLIYSPTGEQFTELPYEHLRHKESHYAQPSAFYRGTTDDEKRHFIVKRIMDNVAEPLFVLRQPIMDSNKTFECVCPKHGRFYLTLTRVDSGHGCPQCSGGGESVGERNVRLYLNKKGIAYKQEYTIRDKRFFPTYARVDFFLPKRRIFIEFQGEQHYGIGNARITHGSKTYDQQRQRDESLRKYADSHGIVLIEIPYTYRDTVGEYLDQYLNA